MGDTDTFSTRVVHFVCGVIVGALAGVGVWMFILDQEKGWLAIPIMALIFGVVAAFLLDRFWENIVGLLPWW